MSDHIPLIRPPAGQSSIITVGPDARLEFAFDQSDANLSKDGQHLIFSFSDGAKLTLEGFYDNFGDGARPPTLVVQGNELPGEQFLAALHDPDLMPAAGPAGSPLGGGHFEDAILSGVDGMDGLDKLGFDGWSRATAAVPDFQGAGALAEAAGLISETDGFGGTGADPDGGGDSVVGPESEPKPEPKPESEPEPEITSPNYELLAFPNLADNWGGSAISATYKDVVWVDPTYKDGAWVEPTYKDGAWVEPTYKDGAWVEPTYKDGAWVEPTYKDGAWVEPTYKDGAWVEPTYKDGAWVEPTYKTVVDEPGHWEEVLSKDAWTETVMFPVEATPKALAKGGNETYYSIMPDGTVSTGGSPASGYSVLVEARNANGAVGTVNGNNNAMGVAGGGKIGAGNQLILTPSASFDPDTHDPTSYSSQMLITLTANNGDLGGYAKVVAYCCELNGNGSLEAPASGFTENGKVLLEAPEGYYIKNVVVTGVDGSTGIVSFTTDMVYDTHSIEHLPEYVNVWVEPTYKEVVDQAGHYEQVVDKEGYYEQVVDQAGHYEQIVDKEGYFEQVVDQEGHYEQVVDKAGYFEQVVDQEGHYEQIVDKAGYFEQVIDKEGHFEQELDVPASFTMTSTGNVITVPQYPVDADSADHHTKPGLTETIALYSVTLNGASYLVPEGGAHTVEWNINDYHATFTIHSDGSYEFSLTGAGAMPPSIIGLNIDYTIRSYDAGAAGDGHEYASSTLHLHAEVLGVDEHGKVIYGTVDPEAFCAANGSNEIHGGAGDDIIYGSAGNDTIFGGGGDNIIFGGGGDDIFTYTLADLFGTDHIKDWHTGDTLKFEDLLTTHNGFELDQIVMQALDENTYVGKSEGVSITLSIDAANNQATLTVADADHSKTIVMESHDFAVLAPNADAAHDLLTQIITVTG